MMVDLIKKFSGFFYSNTVPSSNAGMNIYIVINGKRSFSEFSVKFCVGPLIAETELLAVVLSPSRSHNKVYTGGIWGEQKLHIRHVL